MTDARELERKAAEEIASEFVYKPSPACIGEVAKIIHAGVTAPLEQENERLRELLSRYAIEHISSEMASRCRICGAPSTFNVSTSTEILVHRLGCALEAK
jgi:hypothetical protein